MSLAHEFAWCAGFFDGEGFVSIQRRNRKAKSGKFYSGHYLRIGINHVAPEPLLEIQRIFGGGVRKSDWIRGNRKPRHRWTVSCEAANQALIKMMPYFKNKNKVAEIGLNLHKTMQKNKQSLPEGIYLYRESLKEELQKLNSLD